MHVPPGSWTPPLNRPFIAQQSEKLEAANQQITHRPYAPTAPGIFSQKLKRGRDNREETNPNRLRRQHRQMPGPERKEYLWSEKERQGQGQRDHGIDGQQPPNRQ